MKRNTRDLANKVNHENINKGSAKEIKYQILDLDFDDLVINKAESKLIIRAISGASINNNEDLEGMHKFIYNESLETLVMINATNPNTGFTQNLKKYFQNLRRKMEDALNIPRIIKEFNKRIGWIDGKTIADDRENLPRYEKLIRLKRSYKLLVTLALSIIHNYYWVDITKNEQSTKYNIEDCIRLASPIIINLKNHFEKEVSDELEFDVDETELLNKYKL